MKVVGPVTASLYKLGRCSLLVLGDVHTTAASCGWFAKGMPIDDFIALCVKQSFDAGKSFDMFLETFYVTRGQKPEDFKRFQLCVRKMIERYFAASKWGVGIRRVAQRFAALFLKKQSIPGVRFHYSDIRSEPHVRQFLMLVADVLLCPDEAGLPKALAALAAAVPDARSLSKLLHAFTTAEDFRKARPKFLKPVNSALPATGQHRIAKQVGKLTGKYKTAVQGYVREQIQRLAALFERDRGAALFEASVSFLFDVYAVSRLLYYAQRSDGLVVLYAGDAHAQALRSVLKRGLGARSQFTRSSKSGCVEL